MTAATKAEEFMLTSEVSHRLAVSSETVRQWDRKGILRALRTPTGVRLFKRSDVEALVKARMEDR